MENNVSGNNSSTQNPGTKEPRYRDWHEEKCAWKEERRAWQREHREALHRWPFHGMFWGLVLVLLGVIFLLNEQGVLTGDTWWQSLLIGLGGIFIISSIVHYNSPFRWAAWSKFITGVVLILIGVLSMVGSSHWWPVALLVAGGLFLARFFWHIGHTSQT
jgi:hypothetical protein